MVDYALNRLFMHSVAHLENEKKELVREGHKLSRLGGWLYDMDDGGLMVPNNFESYLVAEVNEKQHDNPLLS